MSLPIPQLVPFKAVNKAISQGKSVYLTDDGYIVDRDTFASLLPNYAIYGDALYKVPNGPTLKPIEGLLSKLSLLLGWSRRACSY